jgi:serine/threonine-protein kinase RsbW
MNPLFEGLPLSQQKVIPSDLDEARLLEEQLLAEVCACGFQEADVFAIKLSLEEGLVNAIRHGNRNDPTQQLTVTWDINEEVATFRIADGGNGFEPEVVPDPTTKENRLRSCGRGLMLMRAYMDEVTFNDRGNEICLVKRKSG